MNIVACARDRIIPNEGFSMERVEEKYSLESSSHMESSLILTLKVLNVSPL